MLRYLSFCNLTQIKKWGLRMTMYVLSAKVLGGHLPKRDEVYVPGEVFYCRLLCFGPRDWGRCDQTRIYTWSCLLRSTWVPLRSRPSPCFRSILWRVDLLWKEKVEGWWILRNDLFLAAKKLYLLNFNFELYSTMIGGLSNSKGLNLES